jgi:hypothetical protein
MACAFGFRASLASLSRQCSGGDIQSSRLCPTTVVTTTVVGQNFMHRLRVMVAANAHRQQRVVGHRVPGWRRG